MKKGVLFTVDSVFSLLIVVAIISIAVFLLRNINATELSRTNINELGMDYLTVLENDGTLTDAVASSSGSELREFVNIAVRKNICAKIKIYDSTGSLLILETKTGCLSSDEISITKRSFVAEGEMYYAIFEGWYSE